MSIKENIQENIEQTQLLNEYKKAVDASTIVSKTDKNGIIIYVNDAFIKISGYSEDELIGTSHSIIRHPDSFSKIFKNMWKMLLNKKTWKGILKNRAKDGSTYYVDTIITPILTSNGEIEKFIAIRHDITKVFEQEQIINRQLIDRLTGLPNRLQLLQDLEKRQHNALTIFNIDAFQDINKLYGHKVGDEILKSVAVYFSETLSKEQKQVYKLPGDVFVILCTESCDEDDYKGAITTFIQKFSENLFQIDEHEIYLSMTAGVSYGNDINILINANIALNNARKLKLPFLFYNLTEEDEKHYASNQKVIKSLKYAISNDLVIPYFQPIYNNETLKIDKYEVLMRLIDEEGEVISPYHFLDIAHKVKIYPELTKIIIHKAFAMFQDKDIIFTINISIEDIRNEATQAYIIDIVSRFNRPNNVVFEIVESEEIADYTLIKAFVKEIKKYGANIAIDDFGSGYSNFMHLLELEPRSIKIDGSIIKNILHDKNSYILTQTIVLMANRLEMNVIAEYVSSKEIHEAVISLGIDYSQGYYFGKPKNILAELDIKSEAASMDPTVLDHNKQYIKEVQRNRLYNRRLFNNASIGLALTDMDGNMIDINHLYCKIIGYTKDEVLNLSYWDITPKKYQIKEEEQLNQLLSTGSYGPYEKEYIHKDGHLVNVRLSGKILENNMEKFIFSNVEDITERHHLEEKLKKMAMIDSLTGIYNRHKIDQELDMEIERAKRYDSTFACVMLDIDHFKSINDTYGHDVGDNVLRELSTIITKHIRKSDRFGRWGGEEFILLLLNVNREQAVMFTEKLRETIANHSFQDSLYITVSFGVTVFNQDDTKKSLLKIADTALYQAKNEGRNKVIFY